MASYGWIIFLRLGGSNGGCPWPSSPAFAGDTLKLVDVEKKQKEILAKKRIVIQGIPRFYLAKV